MLEKMSFEQAISYMKQGYSIRDTYMKEKGIIMYIRGETLYQKITKKDYCREYECTHFNAHHLFTNDWEVLDGIQKV